MDTLTEVPAIVSATVILVSNLFSGHPGSRRWEAITAIFGWTAAVSMILLMFFSFASIFSIRLAEELREVLISACFFCMLQALTRDYERILKPLVSGWFERGRG